MIDNLVDGTAADPVFSLCYASHLDVGFLFGPARRDQRRRPSRSTPSTGTQASGRGGDPSVITLTTALYFPDLDFGR